MPSWISSDHLSCALKDTVKGFGYLRIGRGGRIIVDRCNPFTMEMGSAEVEYVEPAYKVLSEMGPNPFAEWAGKLDLANKGYDNFVGRAQTAETVKEENES